MSEIDDNATLASRASRALRPSPGRPRPTPIEEPVEALAEPESQAEAPVTNDVASAVPSVEEAEVEGSAGKVPDPLDLQTDSLADSPEVTLAESGLGDQPPEAVASLAKPKKRQTKRQRPWLLTAGIAIAALLVLVLGGANIALSLAKPGGDGLAAARAAAIASAKIRVPKTLTYSYKTIDANIVTAGEQLTGTFKSEYTTLLTSQVKPGAVAGLVSTTATAAAVGVVSAHAHSVLVLVFLDLSTTSGKSATPQLNGSRVEVTMTEVGKNWLISALTPV